MLLRHPRNIQPYRLFSPLHDLALGGEQSVITVQSAVTSYHAEKQSSILHKLGKARSAVCCRCRSTPHRWITLPANAQAGGSSGRSDGRSFES
ncbi:hypothetical protein Q1695_012756 [Nippostrongylus brasiliensis]|nr:hypothetical protein Q1695_012756 [Nippostrongylus brasiliensis]